MGGLNINPDSISTAYPNRKLSDVSSGTNKEINIDFSKNNTETVNQTPKLSGAEFETACTELVDKYGKPIDGKAIEIMPAEAFDEATEVEEQAVSQSYKDAISELGKSYIEHMDTDSGNSDGTLNTEEYASYTIKNDLDTDDNARWLKENDIKSYNKLVKQVTKTAEKAFEQQDVNGDGKIDQQEMSASLMAMDRMNSANKATGSIQSGEFSGFTRSLADNSGHAKERIDLSYNELFGMQD
ncbi:MAG: hypothetical protein R3Y28_05900 [Candidatus Gastranaerophilales bacterium]